MDGDAEYIEPTLGQRLLAIAEDLAFLPIMGVAAYGAHWLIVPACATPLCDDLSWHVALFAGFGCAVSWFAFELLRTGWRSWRSGQFPPPGTRVIFRTGVLRGPWVRWNAGVSMALGAAAFAWVAWALATHYQYLLAPCG
jgi:hypothetical protein